MNNSASRTLRRLPSGMRWDRQNDAPRAVVQNRIDNASQGRARSNVSQGRARSNSVFRSQNELQSQRSNSSIMDWQEPLAPLRSDIPSHHDHVMNQEVSSPVRSPRYPDIFQEASEESKRRSFDGNNIVSQPTGRAIWHSDGRRDNNLLIIEVDEAQNMINSVHNAIHRLTGYYSIVQNVLRDIRQRDRERYNTSLRESVDHLNQVLGTLPQLLPPTNDITGGANVEYCSIRGRNTSY